MSLHIEESTSEEISILTLRGQLTFGDADGIREKILAVAAGGHSRIVIDLTNVFYIDSTGLGALVNGYMSLQKRKGTFKLVNPNKRNLELLLATQLYTVFEVFDRVEDAVNSFFPNRESKRFDFLNFAKKSSAEAAARVSGVQPKSVVVESNSSAGNDTEHRAGEKQTLQIKQEIRAGWCVVSASGRADGLTADDFESALTSAARGNERVAVDLSTLDYISSAGLRALLNGARVAQSRSGEFVLCCPRPAVNKVFGISGFPDVINVQEKLPC